jgi:hypothetical protein
MSNLTNTSVTTPNPFDPAGLRLDQSYVDRVGVKKLPITVPVHEPNRTIIPSPIDQNPCAHWRNPIDMMRQG